VASYVASGSSDTETWAIQASDQTIFNWTGTSWAPVTGSPQASKIAVFSSPDPSCGAAPHSPVVLGTDGNVYFYQCGSGAFTLSTGAAAVDISTDLEVRTDGNIYVWAGSFWAFYTAAIWGTDARIGGWANGIFAMPSAGYDTFVDYPNMP
jgi:hypothetical protein